MPSRFSVYSRRGRWLTFGYVSWKSYQEFTDDDIGIQDVYAAGALTAATATLVIPEVVPFVLGWSATRAANPVISTIGKGVANIRTGLNYGSTLGISRFLSRFGWTYGLLHIATMPWQIEDAQQKKEREGVVDYMAAVPLEPGQSPMPIGSLGGPGRFIA